MLKSLHIENYAIIDHIDIEFSKGFTIITGETGAGKSILLGALSLILGQRAESNVLFNQNQKCIIEGCFELAGNDFMQFFKDNELDYEKHSILRREINQQGKSRAFINDTPVNLNTLKELGDKLVDVHSQHKTILINDSDYQLAVIDNYVGHSKELIDYRALYQDYKELNRKLIDLQESYGKQKEEHDYLQFLYNELIQLKYTRGEADLLEEEQKILTNAEEIKKNLFLANNILLNNEENLIGRLSEVSQIIASITKYYSEISNLHVRIKNSLIEIKDIANELDILSEKINYEPERLSFINSRLDLIYSLTQKHRLKNSDDLLEIETEIFEKLNKIDNFDKEIHILIKQINDFELKLIEKAEIISKNRHKVSNKVEIDICSILASLGMPKFKMKIDIKTDKQFNIDGFDSVTFLIDANGIGDLKEISKVASGGELSRLMLAIKSLIAKKNLIPTIIFDEIDIGISGDVADKAGNIMKLISEEIQVIAITHLPQIASKASQHLMVYKEQNEKTNTSRIKQLSSKERIIEIAKMLSGEKVTDAAIENAKVLLSN